MKKIITTILLAIAILPSALAQAQTAKTSEELKAERAQLQTELNSKESVSREKQLAKLQEKQPRETGVKSIDGLAETSKGVLGTLKSNNDLLAKYKQEVKDNGDGEIDITTYKANLSDYETLAVNLARTSALIAQGTAQLSSAKSDAKSLSPLKARPALTSANYSINALKLASEEAVFQTKLVKNLIATIKASGNY